jgi:hypothetical protein
MERVNVNGFCVEYEKENFNFAYVNDKFVTINRDYVESEEDFQKYAIEKYKWNKAVNNLSK